MLTDDAVRAELERIKPEGLGQFDLRDWYNISISSPSHYVDARILPVLRLLATSQQALREVAANKHRDDCQPDYGGCECAQKIASNAHKGGSNG